MYKLSPLIKTGQKIRVPGSGRWLVIKSVTDEGAVTEMGLVKFGDTITHWKEK